MRFVIQEMNNRTYYCDGEATREETLKGAPETASSVPNGVQVSSAPLAKYSSAYYFAESARMSNLVRAGDNVTGFGNQSDTDRHNIMSRLSTVLGERLKYPLWKERPQKRDRIAPMSMPEIGAIFPSKKAIRLLREKSTLISESLREIICKFIYLYFPCSNF